MAINRTKLHFDHIYKDPPLICGVIRLFQVGDLKSEPSFTTHTHRQVVHEITYVVSGKGRFIAGTAECPVQKGDLLVIRKGELHKIVSSADDPLRYFYLGFDFLPAADEKYRELICFYDDTAFIKCRCGSEIPNTFMQLFSELLICDRSSPLLIESELLQILALTHRACKSNAKPAYPFQAAETAEEKLVYDVLHYIDVHLDSHENLYRLEEVFGYSYAHIAHKFTEYIGQSPKEYYTQRRFERANEYLAQGYSITDTAERVGFQSIHAFSRAYKHHFGITPKEYKENQK